MSVGQVSNSSAPADDDDWSQEAADAAAAAADGLGEFGDLDADGVDADRIGKGGKVDRKGRYHFECSDTEAKATGQTMQKKRPCITVSCTVLHSVPGQSPQDSRLFHDLEIPAAEDRDIICKNGKVLFAVLLDFLCSFGIACGVFIKRENKVIDPETQSTKLNLRTLAARLKGTQFIGNVDEEEYDKKDGSGKAIALKLNKNNSSAVDDPKNAETPMNLAALQVIGKKRATIAAQPVPAQPAAAGTSTAKAKPTGNGTAAAKPAFDDGDL